MSAAEDLYALAAPERLEKVPVLEERPAATGTYKARHSASSPGNRGHPGEHNKEKRRALEKQVVQHTSKETGGHIMSTWGMPTGAEHPSALYCGTQGNQGKSKFPARAPIGSLDALVCAFPIPALHM